MNYNINNNGQNIIPNRGIISFRNGDYSYAHAVLQSLSCLDCIYNIISHNQLFQFLQNSNYILTKDLFQLLSYLYNNNSNQPASSQNILNSFEIMYNKNQNYIKSKNVLNPDPFHFLYFLLQFIHIEINNPNNPNYDLSILNNQNIQNQKNDNYMFNLFKEFFCETQNSFISGNFYNIERHTFNCQKFGLYYFYNMKNIFRINVDTVKFYRNAVYPNFNNKISLDDLFLYYFTPHKKICKNCSNLGDEDTKIKINNNVIIVSLDRNSHSNNYKNDVSFQVNINMGKYFYIKSNCNYSLKAFIVFNGKKFISYCYINAQWYKYIDNNGEKIKTFDDLFFYEPEIFIYEVGVNQNCNNNNQNNYNNNQYNNYNNNNYDNNNNSINNLSRSALHNLMNNNLNCNINNNSNDGPKTVHSQEINYNSIQNINNNINNQNIDPSQINFIINNDLQLNNQLIDLFNDHINN